MSVGIYDCFGYGKGYDVLFPERYRLIREAGFDCVMLWWSDKFGRGAGYQEDALSARDAGLLIENIHAPVHEQNYLSEDSSEGENVLHDYLQCIDDCRRFSIPTVVIHLPDDAFPLSECGMKRLEIIFERAEKNGVDIAFENLRNIRNLSAVMDSYPLSFVGFCYDSCHHANYAPDTPLLQLYADRLKAIHLHDNGGSRGQHQLPFDGNVDWKTVCDSIKAVGYEGAVTLEPMNWDYTDMDIREFLNIAFERAKRLEKLALRNS